MNHIKYVETNSITCDICFIVKIYIKFKMQGIIIYIFNVLYVHNEK